ncbi:rubrerythrin-like domain-containing protein [Halapricum sp. CBA1109]|nr:rubrerythrin-like domain-containing protein [Halapricum sp. CBA1109]MUV88531.1 rubrerythrin-like domain-containing protein [Halapricum sp. CBA1109]
MRDVEPNQDRETAYECFECGNIVLAADSPDKCPDCGGAMRNRHIPLE